MSRIGLSKLRPFPWLLHPLQRVQYRTQAPKTLLSNRRYASTEIGEDQTGHIEEKRNEGLIFLDCMKTLI